MKPYLLSAIFALLVLPTSHNSWANDAALTTLLENARSNFADIIDVQTLQTENPIVSDATSCDLALQLSGQRQLVCSWQFDYRDENATRQFKKLNNTLRTYSGSKSDAVEDLDVNHPDFYDLKTYEQSGISLAVSLKDKANLDQTYVFFRVSKSD